MRKIAEDRVSSQSTRQYPVQSMNPSGHFSCCVMAAFAFLILSVFLAFIHLPQYNSFHSHVMQSNVFLTAMKSKPVDTGLSYRGTLKVTLEHTTLVAQQRNFRGKI